MGHTAGDSGADCNPSICPTPSLPESYKREGSQLVTSQLTSHRLNIASVTQDGPRGRADHAGNRGLHPQHLLVVTVPRCPPRAPCVHPSTRQQVTVLHSSRPSAYPCDPLMSEPRTGPRGGQAMRGLEALSRRSPEHPDQVSGAGRSPAQAPHHEAVQGPHKTGRSVRTSDPPTGENDPQTRMKPCVSAETFTCPGQGSQ